MKKNRGIISLILTVVLIALMGFTVAVGFGKTGTGAMRNIKLGLDLAGGVSITYQVKDKNPSDEEMSDTIYKLQRRVEQYSTEASVYQEGNDRINIEIPGVTDANAILKELGNPGSLEFQLPDGTTVTLHEFTSNQLEQRITFSQSAGTRYLLMVMAEDQNGHQAEFGTRTIDENAGYMQNEDIVLDGRVDDTAGPLTLTLFAVELPEENGRISDDYVQIGEPFELGI